MVNAIPIIWLLFQMIWSLKTAVVAVLGIQLEIRNDVLSACNPAIYNLFCYIVFCVEYQYVLVMHNKINSTAQDGRLHNQVHKANL